MVTLLYLDTKFVAIVVAIHKLMWGRRTSVDTLHTLFIMYIKKLSKSSFTVLFLSHLHRRLPSEISASSFPRRVNDDLCQLYPLPLHPFYFEQSYIWG
ncbi:hypothetical protein AVEN_202508-1 [Araneus ventricosus]|uniref:Uncharacterized protein n=1 Tax=Araneus ventricosus TaxID=182803 RepID=A0A4Y2M377_ARAVE|nr:hypothetical protein AVEN_202508-1 [Araneus ventricosus]